MRNTNRNIKKIIVHYEHNFAYYALISDKDNGYENKSVLNFFFIVFLSYGSSWGVNRHNNTKETEAVQ